MKHMMRTTELFIARFEAITCTYQNHRHNHSMIFSWPTEYNFHIPSTKPHRNKHGKYIRDRPRASIPEYRDWRSELRFTPEH